jgi:hypothetical protein
MEMREAQAKYDPLFRSLEMIGAPGPLQHEDTTGYKVRLLSAIQQYSDRHKHVNLRRISRLDSDAFSLFESEICAAAQKCADDRAQGSFSQRGELREVLVKDQSGRDMREFRGSPLRWMSQFMGQPQCVSAFVDPATGRVLRDSRTG